MSKISRREFLRLTAASLGAVIGGPILASCGKLSAPTPTVAVPPPTISFSPTPTVVPPTVTLSLPTATNTSLPLKAARPVQVGSSVVSVVQSSRAEVKDIQYADIQQMVHQAVDLAGGFKDLIWDEQTVVLKPNLYGRVYTVSGEPVSPEASGLVTDWRVTRAVVEMVRQVNPSGKVYVMEGACLSPTAENMEYLKYTAENIPGVDAFIAIETDSGAWQDFNSPGLVKVDLPDGLLLTSYYMNRKYKEADVVISLPVLKNHSYAAITGAVKNVAIGASPANIYGKTPTDDNRFDKIPHDKVNFHKWVHDYYRCRPADFVVMDGLQGLQNGPMCYADKCDLPENQMNMRLILAGRDAVAVDTVQALVMGWDPESVQYLKLLNASTAGNLDTAYITVTGQPVDTVRKDFAGAVPVCGGQKVSDNQPPTLIIEKASVTSSKLNLTLSTDEKTNKVEVYVNDQLLGTLATTDFHNAVVDVSRIQPGTHTVKVWAYDRLLNRAEQVQEVDF